MARLLRPLVFGLLALSQISNAEVVRVEIASTKPWLGGRSLGQVGSYEKLQGRVYFEIDPESAANRRIADIALAPRNAKGHVEFSSDFVVVRPRDAAKARHSVLLEIPNRGLTQAEGAFFTPASSFDLMELDDSSLRDAFLFEQGFTAAWLGWQFDLPAGEIRMDAPAANVNGTVRRSIITLGPGAHLANLFGPNSYCAADAEQPNAQLIVKSKMDDPGRALPRSQWSFGRIDYGKIVPDPCGVVSLNQFDPGQIYEVVYQGANPPIAGLGEAAVRDFVAWLKFGGVASPLREHPETVSHVLGYGYSQSARFLRDYLYRGFNADEHGRQGFDGLLVASAGAGRGSFDHRYAMPGEAGNSVLSDLRPVDMFPFSDGKEEDPVTGASDGLLQAAAASHTVPKIFYTYSSTEYWARVGSLAYTTVDGTKELPLDSNSRLYFYPGTPHSHYPFPPIRRSRSSEYENFGNFASAGWSFRALLLDLDEWVSNGKAPPDSAYPHLGPDLVSRANVKFPAIPGVRFPQYMPRNWRLDYGSEFLTKGIIANEPPKIGAEYTVLVPQVNSDGNDVGGVLLPHLSVPLGTFTGWNYQLPVLDNLNYLSGLVGSFIPFSATAESRRASGDPRVSIAERYADRADYLDKVRSSVRSLVSRRLLRTEDLDAIVEESGRRFDYFTQPSR